MNYIEIKIFGLSCSEWNMLLKINFGGLIFVVFNVAIRQISTMYNLSSHCIRDGTMGSICSDWSEICRFFCYNLKRSPTLLCLQPLHRNWPWNLFIFSSFISLKGWHRLKKTKHLGKREFNLFPDHSVLTKRKCYLGMNLLPGTEVRSNPLLIREPTERCHWTSWVILYAVGCHYQGHHFPWYSLNLWCPAVFLRHMLVLIDAL